MKYLRNLFVSWAGSAAALGALILIAGCATLDDGAAAAADPAKVIDEDTILPGEQVTIELLEITPPSKIEQTVGKDGTITLPMIDRIKAAHKQVGDLQQEIRDKYVPRYYKRMTVNIKRENRYFFVGGEVKNPSQRVYTGDMTVTRAIKSAGDFTEYADKKNVEVIRRDGERLKINVKDALKHPKKDVPIYPGDTIHVPQSPL